VLPASRVGELPYRTLSSKGCAFILENTHPIPSSYGNDFGSTPKSVMAAYMEHTARSTRCAESSIVRELFGIVEIRATEGEGFRQFRGLKEIIL
jgi:hypothetical protein